MVHTKPFAIAAAALLGALPVSAGLYSKSSPVVQLDAKNYDRLIAQSNYTSIVEFYAPWCGHCKNLQPGYEKAAKSLSGLAKVAAIDCDDDGNKAFCGSMGVQGFPTLKIVKPGKKPGKPYVEDYHGPREAKAIVEAVKDKIPNLVTKVDDKSLEKFLADANETAKAILFTEKGKTSALLKAVAIDFKGSISVAQIRNTEKASLELFGVSKFPTLLLLAGGKETDGAVYDGELSKEGIVKFLSQAAAPNPDPAPAQVKVQKPKDSKRASKKKEEFESASSSQARDEASTAGASATAKVLEEDPTESPGPIVESEKPIILPEPAPPLPILESDEDLAKQCLGPRTGTCILALLPSSPDEIASKAVGALSEVAHRLGKHAPPFYVLPEKHDGYTEIHTVLGLGGFDLIAINGKRGWWRALPKGTNGIGAEHVSEEAIESWIDGIRLGEGAKMKLPEGLILEDEPAEIPVVEEIKVEVKEEVHDEL